MIEELLLRSLNNIYNAIFFFFRDAFPFQRSPVWSGKKTEVNNFFSPWADETVLWVNSSFKISKDKEYCMVESTEELKLEDLCLPLVLLSNQTNPRISFYNLCLLSFCLFPPKYITCLNCQDNYPLLLYQQTQIQQFSSCNYKNYKHNLSC